MAISGATTTPATTTSVHLYISDEAYTALVRRARAQGCISDDSYTARGLSAFIEYLVSQRLEDNRPPNVRSMDTDMVRAGMSPEWRMYGPRLPRKVRVSSDTLVAAAAHCLTLGIAYPPHLRILGAPTFHDTAQCLAALLEAVGTGWVAIEGLEVELDHA